MVDAVEASPHFERLNLLIRRPQRTSESAENIHSARITLHQQLVRCAISAHRKRTLRTGKHHHFYRRSPEWPDFVQRLVAEPARPERLASTDRFSNTVRMSECDRPPPIAPTSGRRPRTASFHPDPDFSLQDRCSTNLTSRPTMTDLPVEFDRVAALDGEDRFSVALRGTERLTHELSRSFKAGAGLKPTDVFAGTWTGSPFIGFRRSTGLRYLTSNFPKLESFTSSPAASEICITSKNEETILAT